MPKKSAAEEKIELEQKTVEEAEAEARRLAEAEIEQKAKAEQEALRAAAEKEHQERLAERQRLIDKALEAAFEAVRGFRFALKLDTGSSWDLLPEDAREIWLKAVMAACGEYDGRPRVSRITFKNGPDLPKIEPYENLTFFEFAEDDVLFTAVRYAIGNKRLPF